MTATRLAFSSALVLFVSAYVCNAQRAPSDVVFEAVNLQYRTTEPGTARCLLTNQLSQDKIEQLGDGQLQCVYLPFIPQSIYCTFKGNSCQSVKSICDSLNGQIGSVSDTCKEIDAP